LTTQLQVGQAVDAVYRLLEHSLRLREHPGRIVVRAEESDRWVTVSIHDRIGAYHAATLLDDRLPFRPFASVGTPGGYLNAVREMLEAQGGELFMDEPSGQGTAFQFRFPVLRTELAGIAAADSIVARQSAFEPSVPPAEAQSNDRQS
jgi:signal transduction histidine kinase